MRPLELTLEGFRSHEARTVISFEGRSFIAIVGPTGAGKSSILDAISYALYGKTPRVKSGVKRLVCSRCEEAHVSLRFEVDGGSYLVTRVLPRSRNASGEHTLLDETSGERSIGAEAVALRVEELLGLSFDAFCSSVLLAQGKFANFLEAATTERTRILKGIFRLEQIDGLRAAAKEKLSGLELELATLQGEAASIPEDVEDRLVAAKEAVESASALAGRLAGSVKEEERLQKDLEQAAEEARAAEKEEKLLLASREALPPAADIEVLVEQERASVEAVKKADEELAAAEAASREAKERSIQLGEDIGTEAELLTLLHTAESHAALAAELEDARAALEAAGAAAEEVSGSVVSAASRLESAAEGLDAARLALREAQDEHKAHALRAGLKEGDPCPVCERVVDEIPGEQAPAALAERERAVTDAERVVADAESVLKEAETQRTKAETRLQGLRDRTTEIAGKIDSSAIALAASLGEFDDARAEVERRLGLVRDATRALSEATERRDAAQAKAAEERSRTESLAQGLRRVSATLIEIGSRLDVGVPAVDEDAASLLDHRTTMAEALRTALANSASAQEKSARVAKEAEDAVAALRASLEIDPAVSIATAERAAHTEAGAAKARAEDLAEKAARAKELKTGADALRGRMAIYERLAEDLTERNFLNFLLEDRRRLLSALASEHLREMTGRYRFDDEAGFDIVDGLDGDKRRDVETLSGGETFLASLALALGLAEAVTRQGGRLRCFFLDEGFGSLDPESFDLALDGVGKIVSPDRLIGLVSHVPALAERVDDQIVLEKDQDGSTVVQKGASL